MTDTPTFSPGTRDIRDDLQRVLNEEYGQEKELA